MPRDFRYFQAPAPADTTQLYHDLVQSGGAGVRAAGAALREGLSRGFARREEREERQRTRDFELHRDDANRLFQQQENVRADLRGQRRDMLQQEFQAGENAKTRATTLEVENLRQQGDVMAANARAQAQAQEERRKAQFESERRAGELFARNAVTAELTKKDSQVFPRKPISFAQALYPNEDEEALTNRIMGANAAARPYLDEEKGKSIKELVRAAMKGRDMTFLNPEGLGFMQNQVLNSITRQMGGQLTEGAYQGVIEGLQGSLYNESGAPRFPTDETQAARGLEAEAMDRVKGIFGTTAPSQPTQQTLALDKLGLEGQGQGAPRPVTIAPGDLSDDFYVRMGGSPAAGGRIKNLLTAPDPRTGQAAQFVPMTDADGKVYIAIEGSGLSVQERVAMERAINQPGPLREQLQGLLSLGPGDATSAERKGAGAAVKGTETPPPTPKATTPAKPAAPGVPQPTRAPGGLEQFDAIFEFINGQPK